MATTAILAWAGTDEWRAETAQLRIQEDRFTAIGVQLGVSPLPYRLDYRLDTGPGWVTRRLEVTTSGNGWHRSIDLVHDGEGRWTCRAEQAGPAELPGPGTDAGSLDGALDCDLGLSPLTNTMPILRSQLHRSGRGAAVDLTMAWVSVPDLGVRPSAQRYEPLGPSGDGAVVRYSSGGFRADVVVDGDGFVREYPGLARRLAAARS